MRASPASSKATTIASALLTSLIMCGNLAAQADGTPIRLQTTAKSGKWVTGRAAGITTDSVRIVPDTGADTLRYARNELHRLEVSVGRKSNAGRGALAGGAILGAFGVALGAVAAQGCDDCGSNATGAFAAGFGLGGAAAGAAIGALIGSGSHREQWQAVEVLPSPAAGTGGAGASP